MTIEFYNDWAHVKLISYTTPANNSNIIAKDAQDLVAYCARVSNPSSQINNESTERLIKYLVKNQHWSPLEMVDVTLEINTTRDIARQILRHKSASFQEFSQRYAEATGYVTREARRQDLKNRQNSIDDIPEAVQLEWENRQLAIINQVNDNYQWALNNNIAKECARVILPEGLTQSRLYMKASLRTWAHYIDLRSANGTQYEHMLIARACGEVIAEIFPIIEDFTNYDH